MSVVVKQINKMWFTYAMGHCLALKKGNPAICDCMDEPGGYNTKQNKTVIEGQVLPDFTYISISNSPTGRSRE